jgi:uncharacterized protein with von Willebrand factor type A (vWA) domain
MSAPPTAEPDLVVAMTGFAYALREAGVAADRVRLGTSLTALAHIDPLDATQVYWAARLSLCSEPDDLPRFEALFDLWFRARMPPSPGLPSPGLPRLAAPSALRGSSTSQGALEQPGDEQVVATSADGTEVLRRRDVATMTVAERHEINRMIALLSPRVGRRRTLRRDRGGRERIDVSRTVRAMLRDGGEPGRLVRDHRRDKPRRLVLLLDVSASMAPYADVLLRFAHAAVRVAPQSTEVFTVGTRLTRVTRQLRVRDPELALRAAGLAVPDWSGGTRLGESLQAFLDRWGQRGTARQAVFVIASDGWERGGVDLLGGQMQRLALLAHRVVWINPHRGKAGFAPATGGMLAALPAIDDLVAGHSFEALRSVAEVIARA